MIHDQEFKNIKGMERQERKQKELEQVRKRKQIGPQNNSKAHYIVNKLFNQENGRNPTKAERREFHKKATHYHAKSITDVIQEPYITTTPIESETTATFSSPDFVYGLSYEDGKFKPLYFKDFYKANIQQIAQEIVTLNSDEFIPSPVGVYLTAPKDLIITI